MNNAYFVRFVVDSDDAIMTVKHVGLTILTIRSPCLNMNLYQLMYFFNL